MNASATPLSTCVVIGRWPGARTTGLLRSEQQFRADPVVLGQVVRS
jgi:hypothetical protein